MAPLGGSKRRPSQPSLENGLPSRAQRRKAMAEPKFIRMLETCNSAIERSQRTLQFDMGPGSQFPDVRVAFEVKPN